MDRSFVISFTFNIFFEWLFSSLVSLQRQLNRITHVMIVIITI